MKDEDSDTYQSPEDRWGLHGPTDYLGLLIVLAVVFAVIWVTIR